MGAGGTESFGAYLNKIGLGETYQPETKLTASEIIKRHKERTEKRLKSGSIQNTG
jgi:hypothetical protein